MFSNIRPYQHVGLRLPSDQVKVEQILPNTLINLGKYGSFHANQIIGRPFHLTYEILERSESTAGRELRIVPAAELHADALIEQSDTPAADDGATPSANSEDLPAKSNANITDDPLNQKLTMAEIEALKQDETGSSKDLIAKIMSSHSTLDQKTAFSLAKYTLRKHKKYMRRFSVLPLDVAALTDWLMNERDFGKVLEVRNETLALMGSWANIHATPASDSTDSEPGSRYLVVDDTGGLVVATLAERMGILHPVTDQPIPHGADADQASEPEDQDPTPPTSTPKHRYSRPPAMSGSSSTLTLLHTNTQPNLALLRYFSFDSNNPTPTHPLYTSLKTLSWLQLLAPGSDSSHTEPEILSQSALSNLKSSKRRAYYRKRRRWERVKLVVDETSAGGFNGLIIASHTSPVSILHHLVPLLAGGAQVVVYSPHVEPLTELADLYSTARRTAFINMPKESRIVPSEDFPVDPTLLLTPMLQTARIRRWQVLPGRTHPLMMGKGGSEGYLFVATRVVPAEGKVSARGRVGRRKKVVDESGDEDGEGRDGKKIKLDEDGDQDEEAKGVEFQDEDSVESVTES